jgi:hypothetical protein
MNIEETLIDTSDIKRGNHIIEEARRRGVYVAEFQKWRIDNVREEHVIPLEYLRKLSETDFNEYLDALYCIKNENAGGYDGWVHAHEIFSKLGFKKKEVSEGHRTFVSYTFTPKLED